MSENRICLEMIRNISPDYTRIRLNFFQYYLSRFCENNRFKNLVNMEDKYLFLRFEKYVVSLL